MTAVTAPTLYAFDVDTDLYTGATEIRMEPFGDAGTTIATTNRMAAKSALFRAVFYIQRDLIAEESTSNYERLRKLLEPEGPNS